MGRKISSILVIMVLLFSTSLFFTMCIDAVEDQPCWPGSWILIESDPVENMQKGFRDVKNAYYSIDDGYLYFRLECYGFPDFIEHPDDCRYKWFIDIDDPHDMVWSGGNVVKADYMLFVEDTDNDGLGDIYFLDDVDGDGFFNEWESPNYWYDKLVTDENIANYSIFGNNLCLWVKLESISNPDFVYFTWSTDQENSNINQAPSLDRSDIFSADLSEADTDLGVVKYDDIDPIDAGEMLSYTIFVTNHGPHTAFNVSVFDVLPSEVVFNAAVPSPVLVDGSVYSWYYDDLGVGQTEIINISVTVDSGYFGVISNTVYVDSVTVDLIPGNNQFIEETDVTCIAADLSIVKYADVETIYPGGFIEYTINVTNLGPFDAFDVNVYDVLPSIVVFNTAVPSPTLVSGSVYSWYYNFLGVGQTEIIILNVSVDDGFTGVISNTVYVDSVTVDLNLGNNQYTKETDVIYMADLVIDKSADVETVYPGGFIDYTINVTNHGPNVARGVNVTDTFSDKVFFNDCIPMYTGFNGSEYWWYFDSIDVGESKNILVNVTVKDDAVGVIRNNASVTSDTFDPGDDNDTDDENTPIIPVADLGITKTCDKNQVKKGENLSYILNVTNYGPNNASDVNITDILPIGVDYVFASPAPLGNNGNIIWWMIPFLDAGASYMVTINVTVNSNASGEIVNTAYVSYDGEDLTPGNNQDSIEITVTSSDDGGSGGGNGGGSRGYLNSKPTADADGPYYSFIGVEIVFDGTGSHDNDENGERIVRYDWSFYEGDIWHNDIGATPTYTYNNTGVYNVSLRVYDDEGSSDINATMAFIAKPNIPPDNPVITGVTQGYTNISYSFNISAVDQDGDNLTYMVNWGDGTNNNSGIMPSGSLYMVSHIWTKPGMYNITVTAFDDFNTPSSTTFGMQINSPAVAKEGNLLWYLLLLMLLIIFLFSIFYYILTKRKVEPKAPTK